MMGKIWLVMCPNDELQQVRDEVVARDAQARFLRFSEVGALVEMARAFAGSAVGVALCARSLGQEALDEALRLVEREGLASDVLVFGGDASPGFAARCFSGGATEVIAAGAAVPCDIPTAACMGREQRLDRETDASADDDDDRYAGLDRIEDLPPWEGPVQLAATGGAAAGLPASGEVDEADEPEVADAGAPAGGEREGAAAPKEPATPPGPTGAAEADLVEVAARHARSESQAGSSAARAPLVAVVSGRGGCGKTTLVAAMAACSARAGLRTAVLDLDLMFGNLSSVYGVTGFHGFEAVGAHAVSGRIVDADVEGAAMRIGPGLTLWGPCEEPERAELMTDSAEQLIAMLRGLSDVIFVDTSVQWGDTVAMAVAACDRCLIVGSGGASVVGSTKRVMGLAAKVGVPTTRMTGVFNRLGARGCGEDQAMHFEIGVSLRSRTRIPDGGDEVAGMLSFGQVDKLVTGSGAFARSVRGFTYEMLKELGCPVGGWLLDEEGRRAAEDGRMRIKLPWQQKAGEAR